MPADSKQQIRLRFLGNNSTVFVQSLVAYSLKKISRLHSQDCWYSQYMLISTFKTKVCFHIVLPCTYSLAILVFFISLHVHCWYNIVPSYHFIEVTYLIPKGSLYKFRTTFPIFMLKVVDCSLLLGILFPPLTSTIYFSVFLAVLTMSLLFSFHFQI